MSESKVLSAEVATAAPAAPLPPAGDAQRDEKKRRLETLVAEATQLRDELGIEAIDPAKLRHVDNDIVGFANRGQHLDGSEVEGALSAYVYKWEEARGNNGMAVEERKTEGWFIVDASMPEERRRLSVDGTRRWGTTILMRITRERAEALDVVDRRRRIARLEGVSATILEEAERKGVNVYDLEDARTPAHIRTMAKAQVAAGEAARAAMVSNMRQAGRAGATRVLAQELATKRFDRALRDGTVPGLTA